MKPLTCALILLLLSMLTLMSRLPISYSAGSQVWVTGRVSTFVVDNIFDTTHYQQFNITVWDSNGTVTTGQDVLTLIPSELNITIAYGGVYNFSGTVVAVQTGEILVGTFIVDSINLQTPSLDVASVLALIRYGITIFSSITGTIVTVIAKLIFIPTGYMVPDWILTLVLVATFIYFLMKYATKLGLILIIVLVILSASGIAHIFTLAWV